MQAACIPGTDEARRTKSSIPCHFSAARDRRLRRADLVMRNMEDKIKAKERTLIISFSYS